MLNCVVMQAISIMRYSRFFAWAYQRRVFHQFADS